MPLVLRDLTAIDSGQETMGLINPELLALVCMKNTNIIYAINEDVRGQVACMFVMVSPSMRWV